MELANLFLLELDNLVISCFDQILVYRRYVDDLLIVARRSLCMEQLLEFMNNWSNGISISREANEQPHEVRFLDVSYKLTDSAVHFSTYRKPANAYAYVPWNSSHSRACLKGIIHTEVNRISSTCCDRNDFDWQVTFFRSKLFKRGYPTFEIDRIISAFNNTTSCQPRVARRNIVPFKLNYCMGADKLCIGEILKRHEGKLSEVNISPIQCFTSDRSLFRSRFNRFR